MKKIIVIGITMVALLGANQAQAEGCEIVNGSFEDDGWVDFPPAPGEPNGWDVSVPSGEFYGYIHRDWPTEGTYNLTLYTNYFNTFDVNDTARVSQELNLKDTNEIIFDLRLDTDSSVWDPSKAIAVVLIDGEMVWDSNELGSGEYLNRVYAVEDKYRDGAPHILSFGIRVKVAERLWRSYYTDWDYIECTEFCGGGGLLAGDFNQDCYVDTNDLKLMVDVWLDEPATYDRHNLFHDDDVEGDGGIISFRDFAVLAGNWDGDWADLKSSISDIWLQPVGLEDENNLFHGDDVQPSGIINFLDFAVFAENWLQSSSPE